MTNEINKNDMGLELRNGEKLRDLLWMDDVLLIHENTKEAQKMLDVTNHIALKPHRIRSTQMPTNAPSPVVRDGPPARPGGGGGWGWGWGVGVGVGVGGGGDVQWSMKAWSGGARRGDLPMDDGIAGDDIMFTFSFHFFIWCVRSSSNGNIFRVTGPLCG